VIISKIIETEVVRTGFLPKEHTLEVERQSVTGTGWISLPELRPGDTGTQHRVD